MTYDPELIERLVREARANQEHPAYGPTLRAMADQLEAARREVERMRHELAHTTGRLEGAHVGAEFANRDADRLERTNADLLGLAEAAEAWRDCRTVPCNCADALTAAIDAYRAAKGNQP